ncbi:MAG: translocation/assembly module TamB domain-containing protein [Burkholderiaceae bacterium]|nr:translocation/assembly module TamB domain-containing protein [Sulfuritalea sp.]MCF8175698.1 translocation/assembly module TamB domain-containing protein [Burkholderiaceae bacterium]MCF8184745.1 translocation/assembly module TamB domain-containing protein [Polynucleobacter sp.]
MMSRLLKKSAVYLLRLALALLVLGGLLGVWLGTETALQWGAGQAEQRSNGRLVLGAVHGSLFGPMRIEALKIENDDMRIELKQLDLDWTFFELFRKRLHVDRLALEELRITELRASTEVATLPASLELPLSLLIPDVALGRVIVRRGADEHVLSAIELSLEAQAGSYRLNLRRAASSWGAVQGELTLGDTRPFPITAKFGLHQADGLAYQVDADASGELQGIALQARLKALGGQAELKTLATPFAAVPVAQVSVKAAGINPALYDKSFPAASLGAEIVVTDRGANGLEGSLIILNSLSDRIDQSRLPLREVSARFGGTPERIALSAVRLNLGEAGQFSGDGEIDASRLSMKLRTADFNPAGLHRDLHPLRLGGDLQLEADSTTQGLTAELRDSQLRLRLDARHQDAEVELRDFSARAASGSLSVKGKLALADRQPFQLEGRLRGFNPAEFGSYPVAAVNATFSTSGQLAQAPEARLEFSVADSHFRHQPLSAQGRLNASTTRIWDADVLLRLARNRFEARGALGATDDRLDFTIDADKLVLLDPDLGGKGRASGTVEGRFADPSGSVDVTFSDLSWRKKFRAASGEFKARLAKGSDGRVDLDASLRGFVLAQLKLDHASLRAEGSRLRHALQLTATSPKLDLRAGLTGGWRDPSGWSGQILELSQRKAPALTLAAPANLEIGPKRVRMEAARFDIATAKLNVHELTYQTGEILSRGDFQGISAAWLRDLAGMKAEFKTDLSLGGDWQVTARDSVNGHVALWREGGDVQIAGLAQAGLGLDRLVLNLEVVNSALQGKVEASGARLGKFKLEAKSALSARDGTWGIAGDAPLTGSAELAIDSLAWLEPFLGVDVGFDGALNADVRLDGKVAQPQLAGKITGDRFALALPDLGLNLTQGRFRAELRDSALHLDELTLKGGDGSLAGQGRLTLKDGSPVMQLGLKADKLEVLSRPDRLLLASGTTDVSFAGGELRVVAKVKADRGLIELPRSDAPALSDDVVVLGRSAIKEKDGQRFVMKLALDVDLGDQFVIRGKGLDAQLGGALHISDDGGGVPSARGSIRVVKGAYSAYGQRLDIERGILNFQGPIDNPGLNIVALRKNQPVEAGVAVTGTAQSPSVRLVSNPGVPDSEKLSWLVLGHGFEDSSDKEFGALQAAAGALLAAGESVSLQQSIAHGAGLEDVSLKGGGGLESAALSLGKRLSSRAYLSFEQGLVGATSLVKLNYTLTERISVRAQAGTTPAVDLFYTYSFD